MNEKDDDIAHPGMLSNPKNTIPMGARGGQILPQLNNSPWTGGQWSGGLVLELDKQVEVELGVKERAMGALHQHRKEHGYRYGCWRL
jgi:hypothetical protein